jgi:hypothetical protein
MEDNFEHVTHEPPTLRKGHVEWYPLGTLRVSCVIAG